MSTGTSDSILEDLFKSLPKEPGGDRPEDKKQSKKKLRTASGNENSDRSPSSERVKKSSKKSKKKKKRESSDRDLDIGCNSSSRHKKKKRHGLSDSELSDSLRDTHSKKKKKEKLKLRADIYDAKKTHVTKTKKDCGTVYSEKGEVSNQESRTELNSTDREKLEQTMETLNIPHFRSIVSPKKSTENQSKVSTLTITVPSDKNKAVRHVGYTSVANPSLDIPLPSSDIVLDVIPLPEDAKTRNASVKNSHETENFWSEPKKDRLNIGQICEDVKSITDDNNLTKKEIEYNVDESETKIKEQDKKVASEIETRPANDDVHKPAISDEEDRMMKLISQVIEEVDAKEKEREKYEDGEITSEESDKDDGEVPKKKKKKRRDKEKKPREGDKSEKKRRVSRSPSVRKRRSPSTSSYAISARSSEKRTRRSPSSGARKADRSPSRRRSRSPRGSITRSGHSRYSEQGRGRSRSPTNRRSPVRSPTRHGDKRRRSPERERRRRRSPVRPFRVGGPRDYRLRSRSRSRRRSRSSSPRFDKARLLKIARQNLEKMKFAGILPENVTQGDVWKTIQAGGRTVKDLTDFCTRLAEQDDISESDVSEKEEFRHPFQLKPAPAEKGVGAFQFNIKNAITLPVRSSGEIIQSASKLKEQFPVSSGTTHRKNDNEWVPVEKTEEPKYHPALTVSDAGHRMVKNQLGQKHEPKERETNVVAPMPREKAPERPVVSISELVAKRIAAMRRFQDNPNDVDAKRQLEEIEEKTRDWVSRKEKEYETNRPPSFIDFSTAPQSWASTAQFANAAPVSSGPGLRLLQKMGWQHGEGLGRNKDGNLEPLQLDIKMDKKGLVSREEQQPIRTPISNAARTVAGKHPVSLLMEACGRRRWPPPHFEQTLAAGPDHMKQFLFKVTVNNIDYRPVMASSTKKEAKAQCAAVCLQALGLLPKETA